MPTLNKLMIMINNNLLACVAHGGTKLDLMIMSNAFSNNIHTTLVTMLNLLLSLLVIIKRINYHLDSCFISEIGNLKELKTLVLSFCLISSLPPG